MQFEKHVWPITGLAVHYNQDVINVLQEQVSLAPAGDDFMFRLEHDSSVQHDRNKHAVSRPYFHSAQNTERQDINEDRDEHVWWIDDQDCTSSSFNGFVQIISEKGYVIDNHRLSSLARTCCPGQPLRSIQGMAHGKWASSKGHPINTSSTNIRRWRRVTFQGEFRTLPVYKLWRSFPTAALTPLKHLKLRQWKVFLISDAMFDQIAAFMSVEKHLL